MNSWVKTLIIIKWLCVKICYFFSIVTITLFLFSTHKYFRFLMCFVVLGLFYFQCLQKLFHFIIASIITACDASIIWNKKRNGFSYLFLCLVFENIDHESENTSFIYFFSFKIKIFIFWLLHRKVRHKQLLIKVHMQWPYILVTSENVELKWTKSKQKTGIIILAWRIHKKWIFMTISIACSFRKLMY